MASQEHPRDRIARYRRLMELISDERAVAALQALCDQLQAEEERVGPEAGAGDRPGQG